MMFTLIQNRHSPEHRAAPLLLALAVVFVAVQLSSAAGATSRLSGRQISALFPASISGIAFGRGNKTRRSFIASVKRNGQIIARASMIQDRGRWYVSRGRLCMQFSFLSKGRLKCRIVLRKGRWYHALRRNGTTKMMFRPLKQ